MQPFLQDVGVLTSLVACKAQHGSARMPDWLFQLLQHWQPADEWHVGKTCSFQSSHHLTHFSDSFGSVQIFVPLSICWPQWSAEVNKPLVTSVISLRTVVCMVAFLSFKDLSQNSLVNGKPLTDLNRLWVLLRNLLVSYKGDFVP